MSSIIVAYKATTIGLQVLSKSFSLYKSYIALSQSQESISYRSLEHFCSKLEKVSDAQSQKIIDKLESDKFEELVSRYINLQKLIKMQVNQSVLWTAILPLQESLAYARNRIKEEKLQWFHIYMAGTMLLYRVYRFLEEETLFLESEIEESWEQARFSILKALISSSIERKVEVPWDKVRMILSSNIDDIEVVSSQALTTLQELMSESKSLEEDISLSELQKELWEKARAAMYVSGKFVISGRGSVVTGLVAKGSFAVEDTILLVFADGRIISSKIVGLEIFRKLMDRVEKGMNIGALLKQVKIKDLDSEAIMIAF
jgi:hypothetical protein